MTSKTYLGFTIEPYDCKATGRGWTALVKGVYLRGKTLAEIKERIRRKTGKQR